MIQTHSCNLLYSSIVMTDGLFEWVSVFVMIPCFLKKMTHVFLSVNCLISLFSLHFCLFWNWLSFSTIYRLISLQKWSNYFFISWALCTTVALVVYNSPSAKYLRMYQVSSLWLCKRFPSQPEQQEIHDNVL